MTSAAVFIEQRRGTLEPTSTHAVSAACLITPSLNAVTVVVAGYKIQDLAHELSRWDGIDQVLCADDSSLEHGLVENTAHLLAKTTRQHHFSHLVFSATAFGKALAPRVAAILKSSMISGVSSFFADSDGNAFQTPIRAGNIHATVRATASPLIITVRPTAFDTVHVREKRENRACVKQLAGSWETGLSRFVSIASSPMNRPSLMAARVVVVGGGGVRSAEGFALLERLADALGGSVGATRSAVDAGFAPSDKQVGQTGKVIAPEIYIGVGVSGAIQHLSGIKDANKIVAINIDPDAPIFSVADYGLVADLFDAVPAMIKELSS